MNGLESRLSDKSVKPDEQILSGWLGQAAHARWRSLLEIIDLKYPGVFAPDWVYGGRKHGWGLRYKKSKSFCTLIPERGRFLLQIVIGGAEREKAEAVLPELFSHVRRDYETAAVYHDGKWMLTEVDSEDALADVERLLSIKRKPENSV